MAQVRNIRPGYVVVHPNRDKASCKLVRILVVAVLLASVAVMLVLTIGGWSKLEGLKPVNFVWCLLYLIIAVYIWRWARGLLPIAAALGDPAADHRRGRRDRLGGHHLGSSATTSALRRRSRCSEARASPRTRSAS